MDDIFETGLTENSLNYKTSLGRIIEKYSKSEYQGGGMLVDFNRTKVKTLLQQMTQASVMVNKVESKSPTDFPEDSVNSQDTTGDDQLDSMHPEWEVDKTCASPSQYFADDDGLSSNDLTVSSLDKSVIEVQPEDQDEELEMTLKSNGSSLVELYPSMISRIGKAWRRQHVSEAADSVLRRYRRWRQQPKRSDLSSTFVVTQRQTKRRPKNTISQAALSEITISPAKRPYMGAQTLQSPMKVVSMQESPLKRMRREQHQPVLVMDFSRPSIPNETSLNETFNVSEVSQLEERPSIVMLSPSRPCYPTGRASMEPSPRPRRLSLTAYSPHTDRCSVFASEPAAAMERSDIYGSPVRQSPSRERLMSGLSRSPHAFSRSPRAHSMESFSTEPPKPRFTSIPPQKPIVPLRMLYPQNSPRCLFPQLRSPQPEDRHRLRRHLSFDSSLPASLSYSPSKKLDKEFLKLYHKFVCQSKSSFFNKHTCRICARSSEASRGPSSSSLAALALSPQCSVLRKRHRELDWDKRPQSKRFRDEYCPSSPTSRFHRKEMPRRRLSTSDYEQSDDGFFYSSTNPSMFQRSGPQQRSADQETWMNRRHYVSAADFSGMGSSLESRMASCSSPRKW
ncbi:uncharacterized protein si:dkeyp-117h8.4 [Centropristis striata]|uniref:uncharacterized protein si:dkeyp-117h8.4 n=1 Tax=Centropristis striata TaxID=184440 RepID=UPI0027DFB303|nr:uncharacterized protein si:dkeyp-117h8.4 [Centropristis striata]